jgi:hypothetical protein
MTDRYRRKEMDKDLYVALMRMDVTLAFGADGTFSLEVKGAPPVSATCRLERVDKNTFLLAVTSDAQSGRVRVVLSDANHLQYAKEIQRDGGAVFDESWLYVRR